MASGLAIVAIIKKKSNRKNKISDSDEASICDVCFLRRLKFIF
jgi:hypothetical protein